MGLGTGPEPALELLQDVEQPPPVPAEKELEPVTAPTPTPTLMYNK